jgi:hypothetical protein
MYQLVGEYVMTRKQNFQVASLPGEFLTEQLYSSVAPNANQTMASSLLGNLWPNGARSIRLVRPRNIPDTKENKRILRNAHGYLYGISRCPGNRDHDCLAEYMLDQEPLGFLASKLKRLGSDDPLRVTAVNVKYFLIDEDKDGFVDTVFLEMNGQRSRS